MTVPVIHFHNTLQGFRTRRGMGTSSLEAKPLQHLTEMREEALYDILLDLHKAYDALDHGHCLDILMACDVGNQALHLIIRYWYQIQMEKEMQTF